MSDIVLSLFTGISTASLLFLVGAGMSLIFGAMRVINLAHGSFYMLGAYGIYEISTRLGVPVVVAIPLAAGAVYLLAMLVEWAIMRRTYGKEHLLQLLATYALVLIFADLALLIWGTTARSVTPPVSGSWSFFGVQLPAYRSLVILTAVVVGVVLWALLTKTRLGWMIRAGSENPSTLQAIGYNVPLLNTLIFGLGGALAGLGGAIYAPTGAVAPGLDNAILIEAFVVAVVGGLGSIYGAAVIALLIGLLEGIVLLFAPDLSSSLVYIIMIVALGVRPWGLFGTPER
ncbi:branched-chain amino acid ABC transporter permease [Tessaracoccus sp. MC1865]|uniref:branched-chain amino acid ABC transporter permease n=1 Tax=Tessaracoccus sp. MC1865 TaxID=2760310 RepID=UPI0016007CBB|nr:branched-chain amino acid ABC transporter permease [Tessaracoccus sp. MC1865]MBB1482612.1 branched-chain amino acid ABC transporter permease [Tessaracoccus sp. MC1865]QTO37937.1 branched-chain amino acid ABC transporter permease [Tessaracoccus sp. MC1865]